MSHDLKPVPSNAWRIGCIVALCAFAMIGSSPWSAKVMFAVTSLFVFGTYRRFRLTPKSIQQRWTIAFVNLPHTSIKHRRYTKHPKSSYLEIVYETPTGFGEYLLFGPLGFLWGFIVDKCFPWVGGAYQIWLNNDADDRVLAWQGNSEKDYQHNLELLQSVTGLRHRMR